MKEENLEIYESVVDKWSRLYKSKVGDMFSREELAQEVWLAILTAEEADTYVAGGDASLETYLGTCIRRHMIKLISNEVKHIAVLVDDADEMPQDFTVNDAGEVVEALDLDQKLKGRIEELAQEKPNMRHAPFVLKRMYNMTERAISNEAKTSGVQIGKSEVHNIIERIRDVYKKMTK
ncbi:MAG: RNA polymerase sigma factor [Candidatus Thorarchaeota archaeon]|jgi:DNA-directed RNA polymerase specialized sigma24 family protein